MLGAKVSRFTMAYFATALAAFLVAQAGMVAGLVSLAAPASPSTLAVVHLVTIGWLTLLMLGALHQFVPVISARPLASERLSLASLVLVASGLAGLVGGFLALAAGGSPRPWLPAGGALVVIGVLLAVLNLARTLRRPLSLPGRFVAVGLAFLIATVGVGLVLGLAVIGLLPAPPGLVADLLTGGLGAHLTAGLGGFFTLVAMGVAVKLLAMFLLAPEDRGRLGAWALGLTAGGLGLLWAAFLAAGLGAAGPVPTAARLVGGGAALAGVFVFLADMRRLYRQRRRRALELNAAMAPLAFAALGVAVVLLALAARFGPGWGVAAITLLLFGWLSGLGLTQLYKIVPFLTWLERYGPRLGREPLPRVQDLVDEGRARPWFRLYFAAALVLTAAAALPSDVLLRAAAAGTGAATLAIARELWRVRAAAPAPPRAGPVPVREGGEGA